MIQRIKFLAVAAIAAVLVACGGGGDDSTPQFASNYLLNANVTTNTCNASGLPALNGADSVQQDGRAMSISIDNFGTLNGTIDSDNAGFSMSGTLNVNGVSVPTSITFRSTSTVNTYAMTFTMNVNGCVVGYSGTATRI